MAYSANVENEKNIFFGLEANVDPPTSMTEDASNFTSSTIHGIAKVLYAYVPSTCLLASAQTVAATVEIKRKVQLRALRTVKTPFPVIPPVCKRAGALKAAVQFLAKRRVASC